jgi:hypothetical protein
LYNATEIRRNAVSLVDPTIVNLNAAGLPSTLSRGSTFTVRGTLLSKVLSAALYANSVYTPVEVVSTAIDNVVLKIPAGMATGTYNRIRVITTDPVTRILTGVSVSVTE